MTCSICGCKEEYDNSYDGSRVVIANGHRCIDCEQFTCRDCSNVRVAKDEEYDEALCAPCNDKYLSLERKGRTL